jgi:anti-sigma factor RsiW
MNHWTERDFTNWLYGLKDGAHLEECAECERESARLRALRRRITAEPEVAHDFLAAQRRAIHRRLGESPGSRVGARWGLSLAAMLLGAVLTFGWLRPTPAPAPIYTQADQQLFSDLVSIEQRDEPRAIKPIHNLFEE